MSTCILLFVLINNLNLFFFLDASVHLFHLEFLIEMQHFAAPKLTMFSLYVRLLLRNILHEAKTPREYLKLTEEWFQLSWSWKNCMKLALSIINKIFKLWILKDLLGSDIRICYSHHESLNFHLFVALFLNHIQYFFVCRCNKVRPSNQYARLPSHWHVHLPPPSQWSIPGHASQSDARGQSSSQWGALPPTGYRVPPAAADHWGWRRNHFHQLPTPLLQYWHGHIQFNKR